MIKKIDFKNNKSAYLVATNYSSKDKYFLINNKEYKIKSFDRIIYNIDNTNEDQFIYSSEDVDILVKQVIDREYYETGTNKKIVSLQFGMFGLNEIRLARKKNKLLSLWINLSNVCNLECRYCFNSAGKRLDGELSFNELCNLVTDAYRLGCKKIVIVGSGEPLLDPNFKNIIEIINLYEMETVLFTNGITLNDSMCEFLLSHNVKICLKYHSINNSISDFLIGRNGSSAKINKALDMLINHKFHTFNSLSLANQIFKQNLTSIPLVYRYCRNNNIIPRVSKILFKGKGKTCTDLYPSQEEVTWLFNELKKIDKEEYGLEWGNFNDNVYAGDQGCQLCYVNLFVDVFGNVQPCIGILDTLGNIKDISLKDLWNANCLKHIDDNLTGECINCYNHKVYRCYGCAGRNYLENKSEFNSRTCGNFKRCN